MPNAYWSGEEGKPLAPAPDAVGFLEGVLLGEVKVCQREPRLMELWFDRQEEARARAIDALAAMLPPASMPPGGAGLPGAKSLRERVAGVLLRAAREGADPGVRLRAREVLAARTDSVP